MCYLIINNVTVLSTGKLNKNVVKRGSEPQWCGSNIHDTETSYSELCRMHTWCSENGTALVTYQEILNKMKVQMICSLEVYRN